MDLSISGTPALHAVSRTLLAGHRFPDGAGFPPSYRRFVERAGFCRLFGLWLVYPPAEDGYADSWQGRASALTRDFRDAYGDGRISEYDWMVEPDGDWSLVDGLELFAFSENGDGLFWDTAHRAGDGEFPVFLSEGFDSLTRLGSSFDEALPRLRAASGFAGRAPADIDCLTPARL